MSVIKLDTADSTIDLNGTAYSFKNVINIEINDPREVSLICSPQGHGDGIPASSNLTQPASITQTVREVPWDMLKALEAAFENKTRVRITIFDQDTGRTATQNKAIIKSNPMNASVSEGEGAYDVTISTDCAPKNLKNDMQEVA